MRFPRSLAWSLLILLAACAEEKKRDPPITVPERARLQAKVDAARAERVKADEARNTGVERARQVLEPGDESCPVDAAKIGISGTGFALINSRSDHTVTYFERRPRPADWTERFDANVRLSLSELSRSTEPLAELSRRVDEVLWRDPMPAWTVALIVEVDREAKLTEDGSFIPGEMGGTAWLWSTAEEKVVCASRFDVVSSQTVTVRHFAGQNERNPVIGEQDKQTGLFGDLLHQSMVAAIEGLKVAVEKKSPPPPTRKKK